MSCGRFSNIKRDMANLLLKKDEKKPLNFIIVPRNKTKAGDALIENTEKLSAAKDDSLFRYILRVEVFAARDKDEWEFLKYQMRILENMLQEMYPSPQPPIALIFTEPTQTAPALQ